MSGTERASLDMSFPLHIKGIVDSVGVNGRVKVLLPEYDGLITDWLPVVQPLTFSGKTWAVPRKDTQVIVLPGFGIEDAVVIGSIYSSVDKPPFGDNAVIGMVADDGVTISYDPGASVMTIKSPKAINVEAKKITVKADVDLTGNVTHKGNVDLMGNINQTGTLTNTTVVTTTLTAGTLAVSGATTATGPLTATTITAGVIATLTGCNLSTHTHICSVPGSPSAPGIG
jgi:phage baseplate assembly protein V